MTKRFCTECGTALEEGARFCSECGTKVPPAEEKSADQSAPQQPQTQQSAPQQSQSQQPAPQQPAPPQQPLQQAAPQQPPQQQPQQPQYQQPPQQSAPPPPGPQSQPYVYAPPSQNGAYYADPHYGANQPPPYANSGNRGGPLAPVMSIGSYLLTFFVLSIPIVGFILFIVWAFDTTNLNRRNMLIAQFIWALICSAVAIVLLIIFASSLAAIFSQFSIPYQTYQY